MPDLYLSRVRLRPQPQEERRLLLDPYSRHRFVCRLFPDNWSDELGRPLFRLDGRDLLIQAPVQPDLSVLTPTQELELRRFDPAIAVGRLLSFRLLAAPARRVSSNGKLTALVQPVELAEWLHRKGVAGGFTVLEHHVQRRELFSLHRHADADDAPDSQTLTFNAADYRGVLRVSDSAAFARTLAHGCGRGKAFGFGLLSVVPYQA